MVRVVCFLRWQLLQIYFYITYLIFKNSLVSSTNIVHVFVHRESSRGRSSVKHLEATLLLKQIKDYCSLLLCFVKSCGHISLSRFLSRHCISLPTLWYFMLPWSQLLLGIIWRGNRDFRITNSGHFKIWYLYEFYTLKK